MFAATTLRMFFYQFVWPAVAQKPSPSMFDDHTFWEITEDCLLIFHNMEDEYAHARCGQAIERINALPARQRILVYEMIYQMTPFDFACALAGRQLNPLHNEYTYKRILNGEIFLRVQP